MQDGMNLNEISCHTVVHAEWEAANQGTAQRPMHKAASQRHVGDVAECPLLLVP